RFHMARAADLQGGPRYSYGSMSADALLGVDDRVKWEWTPEVHPLIPAAATAWPASTRLPMPTPSVSGEPGAMWLCELYILLPATSWAMTTVWLVPRHHPGFARHAAGTPPPSPPTRTTTPS